MSHPCRTAGVALAVAAELTLALYVLNPRLALRVGNPTDPSDISSSPAILSNYGTLPIYDISITCMGPGMITEGNGRTVFPAASRVHLVNGIPRLNSGQTLYAPDVCRYPPIGHPINVEAVVRVDFKPLLLPRDHREFRIKSVRVGL